MATDGRPLMTIIDWSRARDSRIGYFAALYTHVETAIAAALARGAFEQPAMLARVNETFLGRYVSAFDAHVDGGAPSEVWAIAFAAADETAPCVIQHLLLGMNAHINFDLAIATTDALTPEELPAFAGDFQRMNALLASLVGQVSADISLFWPLLRWIDRVGRRPEDAIIDVCMRWARRDAWERALRISALSGAARHTEIAEFDTAASRLARVLADPPWRLRLITGAIRRMQRGTVNDQIDDLLRARPAAEVA